MQHNVFVWGYSCDDTHNEGQLFRNYNWMLMPQLSVDALKDAMRNGTHYFSYEYTGSGEAKAPRIHSIVENRAENTITIDTDATQVYWISATDISNPNTPSTRKSTIVAVGKQFDYTGFQGVYVRALLLNEYGETCTQPFNFCEILDGVEDPIVNDVAITLYPNPAAEVVTIESSCEIETVTIYNMVGQVVNIVDNINEQKAILDVSNLPQGHYIISVASGNNKCNDKLVII
jgi:hypothetical protein